MEQRKSSEKVAICAIVKNEGENIAEWIAYHYAIGFDSFIIYDNGSTDNTRSEIDKCRIVYDVKLIPWVRISKVSQNEAYDDCLRSFRFSFDWIAFIDADEFVQPLNSHNIKRVLADIGSASALMLNWCMFGSSGHVDRPAGLTIENFVARATPEMTENRHYKMIVRPLMTKRVENCHDIRVEGRRVFPDGTPFTEYTLLSSNELFGYDICRLNHYFVKSRAHWSAKMNRGYTDVLPRTWHEFDHCDRNEVQDNSMLQYVSTVRNALALIADLRSFEPANEPDEILSLHKLDPRWAAAQATVFVDIPLLIQDAACEFDAEWYRREYGLGAQLSEHELRDHYFTDENNHGRRPNPYFDPTFYAFAYADVVESRGSLFQHFVNAGRAEGRRPQLNLDTVRWYPPRYENPEVSVSEDIVSDINTGIEPRSDEPKTFLHRLRATVQRRLVR